MALRVWPAEHDHQMLEGNTPRGLLQRRGYLRLGSSARACDGVLARVDRVRSPLRMVRAIFLETPEKTNFRFRQPQGRSSRDKIHAWVLSRRSSPERRPSRLDPAGRGRRRRLNGFLPGNHRPRRDCPQRLRLPGSQHGSSDTMSCECGGEDSILINSPCVFEAGRGSFWLGCFWLASIAWGSAVLRNVVTATVAGSVASWWFSPGDKSSVRGALYRATHESFGSLCRASNLVAVVRLLITALRRITKLGRCGGFLLEWLRDAVKEALAYVICFVSIYGLSFSEAGQRVSELFRRRGVTTIANDVVVDIGLAGVVLGATMLYWVVAILLLALVSDTIHGDALLSDVFWAALRLVCWSYLLVVIVVATTLEALKSGVKAVFVCFVQDPEALLANHDRQIYEDLSKAWREMQAESPSTTSEPEDVGIHHA
ncbi:unnamed protein product [Scytosiphon promiscuus]